MKWWCLISILEIWKLRTKKSPRCYSEIFKCLKPQSAPSWVICCPPLISTPCKLPLTKLFSTGKAACTFQMGCPILLTHKNLQLFPTIARMMWLAGLLMSFLRPACPTPVSSYGMNKSPTDERVTYGWTRPAVWPLPQDLYYFLILRHVHQCPAPALSSLPLLA